MSAMRFYWSGALLGSVLLAVLRATVSDGLDTVVRPSSGSAVSISTSQSECSVCEVSGVNATETTCHPSLLLTPEQEVRLRFQCSEPTEQAFSASITHTVDCTEDSCSPSSAEAQDLLSELPRTYVWTLSAPPKTTVTLDLQLSGGLSKSSGPCSDGVQVFVSKSESDPEEQFCRGGPTAALDVKNKATVKLMVTPNTTLGSAVFVATPLKGRLMEVTVAAGMELVVSRKPSDPECDVCSGGDCSDSSRTITTAGKTTLEFSCANPQDSYAALIRNKIACAKASCSPDTAMVDPELFKGFKRTLTWDISVPPKTVLSLDFPLPGLEESPASCANGFQYLITSSSDGADKKKSYCRGSSMSSLSFPGETKVILDLSKDQDLPQTQFTLRAEERGSRMLSVSTDPDTKVTIRRDSLGPDCDVCVVEDSKQQCSHKQVLRDPRNVSVEFSCKSPQDHFTIEIIRDIDCAKTSCSSDILKSEFSMFPDFNRTFIWDLKVVPTQAFQLDFPEPGMRQVPNKRTCPDEHTYSVVTYLRSGPATIGTFCKGGTVSSVLVRYKGRMFLHVPGDRKLDPVDFTFSHGPQTDMVAILKVTLPRGVSSTTFITPNYPGDFPDKEEMQWDFVVPGMHNYTMSFTDYSLPECLNDGDNVVLEYHKGDKKVAKFSLTDPQPKHQQGNFKMVLKNCATNRTLPGLTLDFKVSVMRSGHPVLCTVDLSKQQALSVHIEKVGSDPYCEMTIDSKLQTKIDVAPRTKALLSFLDCPNEDVQLTTTEVIECYNSSTCPEHLLSAPKLDSCLPMPLHSAAWRILMSLDSTVDLVSPTGTLRQDLPGQKCTGPVRLHVEETGAVSMGHYCFNGPIQKVQAHTNISVTVKTKDLKKYKGPFLNVSFSPEIPETLIYSVTPDPRAPVLLGTPNWPQGMSASSTVSWIVTLPRNYQALLHFPNVSQPKCADRHTNIRVKMLGYEEELMSRREDEAMDDKLTVPYSFYLNMSNCVPEEGDFGAVAKVVLQKKSNLLAIVLGIAGALLLLLIVLVVVCVVTKRKKQKMSTESSIYMGKGNIFRPNDRTFSKSRSDNESHVYASIDETMIYGHLLGDTSYADSLSDQYKGIQTDSYHTFTGPPDGAALPTIQEPDPEPELDQYRGFLEPSETFIPSRPRTPIDRQDSLGFQDRRMVDNELYTFKSTGDFNTIRLSGVDQEPQPPIDAVTEEEL